MNKLNKTEMHKNKINNQIIYKNKTMNRKYILHF